VLERLNAATKHGRPNKRDDVVEDPEVCDVLDDWFDAQPYMTAKECKAKFEYNQTDNPVLQNIPKMSERTWHRILHETGHQPEGIGSTFYLTPKQRKVRCTFCKAVLRRCPTQSKLRRNIDGTDNLLVLSDEMSVENTPNRSMKSRAGV
jgi:hypothetical protein